MSARETIEQQIRRAFEEGFTMARAQTSLFSEDGPWHPTYRRAVDAWPDSETVKVRARLDPPALPEQDHGGTSLTAVASVSGVVPASTASHAAPCLNCGHTDAHNGYAGGGDGDDGCYDACTHKGCNCGWYTPEEQEKGAGQVSTPAQPLTSGKQVSADQSLPETLQLASSSDPAKEQ